MFAERTEDAEPSIRVFRAHPLLATIAYDFLDQSLNDSQAVLGYP